MATMAEIRSGLATRLSGLSGFQVSAYMLANPTPPAVHVIPDEIEYDLAGSRGADTVTMKVQAFVALSADIGSQVVLDGLLAPTGASSVKALIEGDRTLGGVVDDLRVTQATGYRTATIEGRASVLMCEWSVQILD